jgi:hypothetical protein
MELKRMFPESLLTNAADYGDAVEITSPLVTPSLLQLLKQITQTGQIPALIPVDVDYVSASHYLNIPLLIALSDPWFPTFRFLDPRINQVPIPTSLPSEPQDQDNANTYSEFLGLAISGNAPSIVWYLIQTVASDRFTQEIEASTFVRATYFGTTGIVQIMLPRVNPVTARSSSLDSPDFTTFRGIKAKILRSQDNQALKFALYQNHNDMVALLLADPRMHLTGTYVYRLAYNRSLLNFQRLLLHPDTTAERLSKIITTVIRDVTSEPARMVYAHPNYNPNLDHYVAFGELIDNMFMPGNRDAPDDTDQVVMTDLQLIYWNPRTQPGDAFERAFVEPHPLPTVLVLSWISDPRLQPLDFPDGFLMSALYWWSPTVLTALVQRFPSLKFRLRVLIQQPFPEEAINHVETLLPILE